jgi:hypothetical protein
LDPNNLAERPPPPGHLSSIQPPNNLAERPPPPGHLSSQPSNLAEGNVRQPLLSSSQQPPSLSPPQTYHRIHKLMLLRQILASVAMKIPA